jgi:putative hemolysin
VQRDDPFRLSLPPLRPFHHRAAYAAARPVLSRLLALDEYRRLYERTRTAPGRTFCARALQVLGVTIDVVRGNAIPLHGPLVIVANHPHGLLDGLALIDVVEKHRPDVRVLTNHLLAPIPELATLCFFVDAFDHRAASQTRAGLRAARRWLQDGHVLVVFPAGAVACDNWRTHTTPLDARWHDTVTRLASSTDAAVVPTHISGRNSELFYRLGAVHPAARTLLLARELLRQQGRRIAVHVGEPVKLSGHDRNCSSEITTMLRAQVEALPSAAADLAGEVQRLPSECRLLQSGRFDVYCAPASRIRSVLVEIARLREITFRSVGEGTGQALDLDRFDQHYLHLFVWDREAHAIAGAYRLGTVDTIVAAQGIDGLYTSTLYKYDERLLSRLGAAIELGRSFVRAEYQRSSNALLLLWKGIAQFVARSGRYDVLFGPVSISARYSDMSRQLLQGFLFQNARHRELADLVTAITPPSTVPPGLEPIGDVQDLDRLIAGHEPDGKGIPALLRQYLRLNAKLLAFNIDPAFGDALDALMMVDLTTVDRTILTRFFGTEYARRFLSLTSGRPAA